MRQFYLPYDFFLWQAANVFMQLCVFKSSVRSLAQSTDLSKTFCLRISVLKQHQGMA